MTTRKCPRVRALLLGTVLIAATSAAAIAPAAHAFNGVFVGACTIELDVSYSPSLAATPGSPGITFGGGSGTCVMEGMLGTVNMGGGATGIALGCAEGAALGLAYFTFDIGAWEASFPAATIVLTNTGGVIEFAFTQNLHKFAGAGAAVPEPAAAALCPVAGVSATTWTVAFGFEDPDVP